MKAYEKYKDSGIEWIGEIPEHWETKRIDWSTKIIRGNTGFKKDQLLDNGDYVALQYGKTYKINEVDSSFNFFVNSEFYKSNQIVKSGDVILISTSETVEDLGHSCFYSREDLALLGGEQIVLSPKKAFIEGKYLYYFAKVFCPQLRKYAKGIKVFRFNIDDLKTIYVIIPPTEEQTAIANYLDKKTAEIDQLIADKEQLVTLYQEEKTAIINQAVTKGVNPDVKLKESGIEWLGDIPERWVVKKLNWCFNTIGSGTTPKAGNQDYYFNGTHNWLLTGDLNDGEIHKTTKKITDKALNDYSSLKEYGESSVVIAMYGATIGKLGVLKIPTTVNQACCVLSEPIHLNYDFTFFLLLSARQEIINMSYGGGQPNISQELLKQFKIQVPPKDEQTEIVQHIEKESTRIDAKIAKAEKYIKLLTEYRTALISEVVTGKMKVV